MGDMVAMEGMVDTVTAASADLLLLKLKPLQLHITDMAVTEDMADMDMVVNDDLLSLIMDMEVMEGTDTDMDDKLIPLNSDEKNSIPYPKSYQMMKIPVRPMILSSQNKKTKKEIFDLTSKKIKKDKI